MALQPIPEGELQLCHILADAVGGDLIEWAPNRNMDVFGDLIEE